MSEKLLSRVIMLPNGDVHIAFSDTHSIKCTSHNLFCFLSNPLGFIKKDQFKHTESTREVNPKKTPLEHIKGLTLIKVYDDLDIVCVFPKLFQALTNDASRKTDEILNLREYIYSADISDEKHLLLRFFCEFTNSRDETIKLNNYSKISENSRAEIMKETYDSFFLAYTKADSKKVITKNNPVPKEDIGELSQNSETETFEESTVISDELGENYISVADYAKLHNIKEGRVRGWLESKKIRDVKRVKEGKRTRVYINKQSPLPNDGRKGRTMPKRALAGIREFMEDGDLENATYDVLQKYMKKREGVSAPIRKRITYFGEIRYYRTRYYREVCWDDQYALIIDINPEYYCERLGKTNRQLIADEKSPVVPNRDDVVFDLHHIGQENDSPLAIVPSDHHLQEYNSVFHSRGIQKSKINRANFEIIKKAFWKTYIEIYDKYSCYEKIPGTRLHAKYDDNRPGQEE